MDLKSYYTVHSFESCSGKMGLMRPHRLIRDDTFRFYVIFVKWKSLLCKNPVQTETVVSDKPAQANLGRHFTHVY